MNTPTTSPFDSPSDEKPETQVQGVVNKLFSYLPAALVVVTLLLVVLRLFDGNGLGINPERIDGDLLLYIIIAALIPVVREIESVSWGDTKIVLKEKIKQLEAKVDLTSRAVVSTAIHGTANPANVERLRLSPPHTDDPHKGKWGSDKANGRRISAVVRTLKKNTLYSVELVVESTNKSKPLEGTVVFHLHPTFKQPEVFIEARNGKATLLLTAWGAFTVGAECKGENGEDTKLELDLSEIKDAPADFRLK